MSEPEFKRLPPDIIAKYRERMDRIRAMTPEERAVYLAECQERRRRAMGEP